MVVPPDRDENARKRAVRRTAIWMALLAFGIYAAFIISSVLRAR
jgi:hypothetical protein